MVSKWIKYWYICTGCDSSIEVVSKYKPHESPGCICGSGNSEIVLCQGAPVENKN